MVVVALAASSLSVAAQEQPAGPVRISEFIANPEATGNDGPFEWVELQNDSDADVVLSGWSIGDVKLDDPLPEVTVPARGFVVVAGKSAEFDPGVIVVRMADGLIGGGLNNGEDVLRLIDASGAVVDSVEYGTAELVAAGEGYSLVRKVDGRWRLAVKPSPGAPNVLPSDAEIEQQFPIPMEFQSGESSTSKVAWGILGGAAFAGVTGAVTLLRRKRRTEPHGQ